MCIRDRARREDRRGAGEGDPCQRHQLLAADRAPRAGAHRCLLYTSDAADERSSVDLGGRRIIKKKNTTPTGSVT